MNKITVVCHKDHSHGYEDFEGKCLLCVVDGLLLDIANLMVQNQNFAPPTDFIGPSVVEAISKREWVDLTDEEIKEIVGPWGETPIKGYTRKLFDAIEAKLKEKNT
jgi:hypothetical protein